MRSSGSCGSCPAKLASCESRRRFGPLRTPTRCPARASEAGGWRHRQEGSAYWPLGVAGHAPAVHSHGHLAPGPEYRRAGGRRRDFRRDDRRGADRRRPERADRRSPGSPPGLHNCTAALERRLGRLFPHVDPTDDFAWCGSFGASADGTPTIDRVPRQPNCYVAMGYGGNGITFSMMAAQVLRGLITGVGDPDADLVSFRRRAR